MTGQDRWRRSETWTRERESCPSTAMPTIVPALSSKEEVRQSAEGKTELFTNTYTYTYIEERAGFRFNADSEVYLGLWNGHSENVRMAWKWIDSSGEARYSVTRLDMNGTRSGMIDEIDKEIFEKFKGISVRMF